MPLVKLLINFLTHLKIIFAKINVTGTRTKKVNSHCLLKKIRLFIDKLRAQNKKNVATSVADAPWSDIVIAGGLGYAPLAIPSQSWPSEWDSNMTINDCKTSGAKETALFSLCARRTWHFNRAVPLAPKVISVQIICSCICSPSRSGTDSANQIMS